MLRTMTTGSVLALLVVAGAGLAQDAGKEQLASQLNVSADDFTMSELVQLRCRLDAADSDADRERIIESVKGFGAVPAAGDATAGQQVASDLGIDTSQYSPQELAYLRSIMEANDCTAAEAEQIMAEGEAPHPEAAAAKEQLAMELGVDPSAHTLHDLVQMRMEREGHEN